MLQFNTERLYLIPKEGLAKFFFYAGIMIAFYGSMYPWFLWPIESYYMIPAAFMVFLSLYTSMTLEKQLFSRNDFYIPLFAYAILSLYQIIVNEIELNGYIAFLFNIIIYYSLFRYNPKLLFKLSTFLAKSMAIFLTISIPFFLLYIFGFPLKNTSIQFHGDAYSFTNYYFFLIDDRQLFAFFPRFQSVFLEPAHLGTALVVLLQAQRGYWKKWYNFILLASTLLTFSLGAYIYLITIIFLNLWTNGRKIFKQLAITITILSSIVIGSFFYNEGDNLIHNLILIRLEVKDGDIAGNNRVSDSFESDYQNFLMSNDIIFGTDFERISGASGYKVYFYDYGIVGILLLICFYWAAFYKAKNKRAVISAVIIALLIFGVDAFVLWYNRFIPLLCTAYRNQDSNTIEENKHN